VSQAVSLKRIAFEAAAVVASILLAFGIDAAWDARQEGTAELAAIEALRAEMGMNLQVLVETIRYNDEAWNDVAEFLRTTPQGISSMQIDSVPWGGVEISLWAPFTFDPELGATTAFLGRPEASSEHIRELRRAVVNWDRQFVDAGEESRVLWESSREVLSIMTPYVADLVPAESGGPGLSLIYQDYSARLAQIRADQRIVAAVIAKFNLQMIYTGELRDLLEETEHVLDLLDTWHS
jgi:hypothetical protein